MLCNRCNNVVPDGSLMCNYCGNDLSYLYQNQTVQNDTNKNGLSKGQKTTILILLVLVLVLLLIALKLVLDDDEHVTLEDGSRTIMIYMVGSNLESDSKIATSEIASIDPDSIDLDKTNILLYTGGTKKWHNFVSNEENAIYELKEDGFEKVETYDKKNMGDYETLLSFLNYSTDNYEAQYYDLVFYNHGGAIQGAIYDDFTNDNLSLLEFEKALDKSDFNEKNKLNTVLFRTCLNGTIEIASVFAPYADYLIASEEVTNGQTGESVLNFINELDKNDDAVSYGKKFIKAYEDQMANIDPLGFKSIPMYSIIDLSKIEELNKEMEKYFNSIDLNSNYSKIIKLRTELFQFGYSFYNESSYDMVDLYSLVEGLDDYTSVSSTKVLSLIDDAVVYNWASSKEFHGLSVYFPYRGSKEMKSQFLSSYDKYSNVDSYTKFIKQVNSLSTSNKASSFANFSNKKDVAIDNKTEFSLKLSEEQKNDYADSIYIVFSKQENGKYKVVYSSDNATLDGNTLKTSISNNLIKATDKESGESSYLMLVERNSNGKKSITTSSVLTDVVNSDPFRMTAASAFFDFKEDGTPYVNAYISLENGKASGAVIDSSEYQSVAFITSDYEIFDQDGNYTENWDNNGVISGPEFSFKNLELSKATLDDNGDYYCIFKITDIYGNTYYSDILNIN